MRSRGFDVGASPIPELAAGAARYRKVNGFLAPEQDYSQSVIPASATRQIGEHYMRAPQYDARAEPAYHAMALETSKQFEHLTKPKSKGGMGIDVQVTKEDPYGWRGEKPAADYSNYHYESVMPEMRRDLEENNRIKIYSTNTTGGHPFFGDETNDKFRAVHDVFGHMASGRGIDRHGEDAAYQKHAAMYSPLARGALAMETRGQQGALHVTGDFQEQKVGILPQRWTAPRNLHPSWGGEMRDAAEMARGKNTEQGL